MSCILTTGSYTALIPLAHPFKPRRRGEREIRRLCAEQNWTIGALNIQPDHVPLFLSAPPTVAPSEIAHQLTGATARAVFQRFPESKNQLWGGAFWSRSYYVGSVGDMSLDVVLKYIELGQD